MLVSILTTLALGKPYIWHDALDVHWPTGLGSTFVLVMLSGVVCTFGGLRFAVVARTLSRMKAPEHRTYGAKFHLVEEGRLHEGAGKGDSSGVVRVHAYEMSDTNTPKDNGHGVRAPTTTTIATTPPDTSDHRTLEYRVMLRPLDPSPPVTPVEFESMWSSRWGSSTTVVYQTTLKPNAPSICESLEERNIHIIAKGPSTVFFCAQEIVFTLETQRPGMGYNTARRGSVGENGGGGQWSVSPGYETTEFILCEMKLMQAGAGCENEIWIEIRSCDVGTSNLIALYVQLFHSILRKEHGVYKTEYS